MYNRNIYHLAAYGVTLIELMISLTVVIFLLGTTAGIYLTLEHQYRSQFSLIDMHQQSQVILHRLSQEFKLAGFIGCPYFSLDFPLNNTTSYIFNQNNALEYYSDSRGSSIITIRHRSVWGQSLKKPMTQNSILNFSANFLVKPGEILLISDCRHADLFQVAKVIRYQNEVSIITVYPLRYQYAEDAEVGRFEVNTYSVEKAHFKSEGGQPILALYMMDLVGHKAALIEGVQRLKMQVYQNHHRKGVSIELEERQDRLTKRAYLFISLRN